MVAAIAPAGVAAADGQLPSTATTAVVGQPFTIFFPARLSGDPTPHFKLYRLPGLRAGDEVTLRYDRDASFDMYFRGPNPDDYNWHTDAMRVTWGNGANYHDLPGAVKFRDTVEVRAAGDHLLHFKQDAWSDVNLTVLVESITRPCVVPTAAKHHTMKNVAKVLADAGCSLGRITYRSTPRYAVGRLVQFGTTPGTKLAAGTKVNAVVRGCVVPSIKPGTTIAAAKKAIGRSGCVVGVVKKIKHATVLAGRVVGLSRKTGAIVAPGTKVNVVVSTSK